ncbi:MAG: hypothetical protein WDW36_006546 [Sanguina aurantia]
MSPSAGLTDELADLVEQLRLELQLTQDGDDQSSDLGQCRKQSQTMLQAAQQALADKRITYDNGDIYEGDSKDGKRHGKGSLYSSNGDVYKGEWRDDLRHGRGTYSRANGFRFNGGWVDGMAQGVGEAIYPEGHTYDGEWLANGRSGWGMFVSAGGEEHEGEWKNDLLHGAGRWVYTDKSEFEGRFERGVRAEGRWESADGRETYDGRYRGEWCEGLRHGQGEVQFFVDGTTYEGQWKADARDGTGTLRTVDGSVYSGEWKADKQHGAGRYRCAASGETYEGGWEDGVRCGRGNCVSGNGDRYSGEWRSGGRHGSGSCVFANGDKYAGQWERDQRHGQGAAVFADGVRFRGRWDRDAWVQSAADPRTTVLGGPGLVRAVAGGTATFMIQARDEEGNRRLSGGEEWLVSVHTEAPATPAASQTSSPATTQALAPHASPPAATGSVEDLGDGTYRASYRLTTAGIHYLSITNDQQEHIGDSPYTVRVAAGPPCLKKFIVEGGGRRCAAAGQVAVFTVVARDAWGNACEAAQLPKGLQATLSNGRGDPLDIPLVSSASRGSYAASYSLSQEGWYRLEVKDAGGRHLPGSPFSVTVSAPGSQPLAPHDTAPVDQWTVWERRAETLLQEGTDAGGGEGHGGGGRGDVDDADGAGEEPEAAYVRAHTDVPVVENLSDIWKISRVVKQKGQK